MVYLVVLDRPGQVVLNIDMTEWTRETEKAILEGKDGLPKYYKKLDQDLLKIVQLVKKNLSLLNKCTMEALIVLDVHNREVVKQLIEARVTSITDFDYEAQLRYYWEMKPDTKHFDTIVRMINASLDYNYEYLGNSSRLVITPLTDKCYRTLCGAIGLNYGGAPEGPAGTGKTETVKDLAKALARMIVVFNCSDTLNVASMGKFFKGLCCTGGWSCFDEFNLLKLEVLSVIAQQLQSIQVAVKEKKPYFEFIGSVIKLKPTCNCFITMNPGYAGRSELPDNLKALFRSVAMMVPDYALIGQIRLYSFGFSNAGPLSKKIVTTYKLCSEQISAQKHYDYGMRAVNSVLVAAGNLRKKAPNEDEDVQILRAINEVNEAKFLSIDLPLFKAITGDLFPTTTLPEADFSKLTECLKIVIERRNLQAVEYFIEKIIQIYQMILVRHGLMVVGEPYGCKTSGIEVLAEALTLMHETYGVDMKTEFICVNPKSITLIQLYGTVDIATSEWTDGVLPVKFKQLTNDVPTERRWLWFDGPVDAIWIESMNTVLDDNKKLCLSNGDIFYMSNTMNLIIEPMDLLVASPATVSRCGMILMEPHMMGWKHIYKSWKNTLPKNIEAFELEDMDIYFDHILTPLVKQFEKGHFDMVAPSMIQNMVTTLLKMSTPFLARFENKDFYNALEYKERKAYFDKVFTYATVWSFGATLVFSCRQKFDAMLKKLINSPDASIDAEAAKKHRKIELPDGGSGRVFEYQLEIYIPEVTSEEEGMKVYLRWTKWADMINENTDYNEKMLPNEIIVDTVDLVRYSKLVENYIDLHCHVLVCGPTGTGKTIYIKKILNKLDRSKFQTLEIGFSAQTTAMQLQEIIDSSLMRRPGKGVFGPPPGKKLAIFVDDLSMPRKEQFGAQPPIELLRQLLDKGGWYDHNEKSKPFKTIQDLVFLSAMGPPGNGRNDITPRFQRLMCLVSFASIDESQMELIFRTILNWRFTKGRFEDAIMKLTIPLVKATFQIYSSVTSHFKPLPSKSHYLFNLRDFARVIFGVCMADRERVKTKEVAARLWCHEIWRVFGDRLNSVDDRLYLLNDMIKKTCQKVLGENFDTIMIDLDNDGNRRVETLEEMRGLVFTDLMSAPTLKVRPYEMITDYERLVRACESALQQYDSMTDKPLNIVLFNFAIEHLLVISRILKQPGANALLVGVGGSGRTCLTKLAAKMSNSELFSIELTKQYDIQAWKNDLKLALKSAGGKAENTVFLFRDSQIKYESFVEDINNLLNNAEVPNLFPPEEKGEILELSRKNAKAQEKEGIETPDQLMGLFVETTKKKLHVVLCFSPIGSGLRDKIRMFPALVNCCTIDWFFEWPTDALVSVAEKFIGQVNVPEDVKAKCVEMVKFFHIDTQRWADDFLKKLKRNYYVTPTSFIEMINQFKGLLEEKTESVSTQQFKYQNGYTMIIEADESVEGIKQTLKEMAPGLEKAKIECEIIVAETEIKKKDAEVVQAYVAEEKSACEIIASKAKSISEDCRKELNEVLPVIEKALESLNNVDKSNFEKMRGPSIAQPLQILAQCLAITIGFPEEKMMNADTMRQETDWKKTTQKLYLNINLLIKTMKEFNDIDGKDVIENDIRVMDEKTFQRVIKIFSENPKSLDPEKIKYANGAAGDILTWVESQVKLQPTEIGARPKRANYLSAKKEYEQANAKLELKQRELKAKEDELAQYTKKLEESLARKKYLEDEFRMCKLKLDRSEILIENLKDEKERWRDLAEELKVELGNLVGDVLLSSAVISYLGPFTSGFRSLISREWGEKLKELKLPSGKEPSLVKTFGDPVKIRFWQIKGLPSDDFSTENSIIMTKSRRWSLCIDPQVQANKWLKNMESERIVITNFGNNFMKDLEKAIRNGMVCLFENVGEEIDPALDPVLLKLITGSGAMASIKLGDKSVDYNKDFVLYFTSKERNPHYLPEVSTKVTIINFMITSEGLSDQLLAIVVSLEMPEKEAQKNQLIAEGAKNKEELRDLENEILQILALPKQKLLEDDDAINVLTKSKRKSNDIQEKQKVSEVTEIEINEARKMYVDIGQTTSCLFFAISDLGNVDPMYQYSLSYFIDLFKASIEKSEKAAEVPDRLINIDRHFLYSLYLNISRSLFVKDKLLFSFLLSVRIRQFKGEISDEKYAFLMSGAVIKPSNMPPIPSKITWINQKIWENICKLAEFKGVFENFHRNFEVMTEDWTRIFESEDPSSEPFPQSLENKMGLFDKMLVISVLRPDKVVHFIRKYVAGMLGEKFVDIPAFDLEEVYGESAKTTPLIFVLTPGVDPFNMLQRLANTKGVQLDGISLGQGQGEMALNKIAEACDKGTWVILQNCHLAEFFMSPLEKKCDEITLNPTRINDGFRLWLTSYPSKKFPPSILQNGIKMTNEPPSGLKNSLKAAFLIDEIRNPANFNKSENPGAYKRLLFGLCFFHSVIQERRVAYFNLRNTVH